VKWLSHAGSVSTRVVTSAHAGSVGLGHAAAVSLRGCTRGSNRLTGLGDGPMDPSHRVMNNMCVYFFGIAVDASSTSVAYHVVTRMDPA
jgi:hypothetical protein